MFIPDLFNERFIAFYDGSQFAQCASIESVTVRQVDLWRQPEFCLTVWVAYMDVHGFARVTFIGIEEEPERFVAEDNLRPVKFTVPGKPGATSEWSICV